MEVETYSIEVNDNINLNSAKILLQNVSYVYPEEQLWFCNNIIMNDVIEWKENHNYSVVVNNKWFTFNLKTMSGIDLKITHLTSRDKVLAIKYVIYTNLNLLPDSYSLYYNSSFGVKELNENEYIGKYFIPDGSTINLTIKLKSGFGH